MPTVVPDNVTGAVTLMLSCFVVRSTDKILFDKLRGLEVVKLGILVARPEFTKAWVA